MASQGKKGKKAKGKTVNLNDFLASEYNGDSVVMVPTQSTSWADAMDEEDENPAPVSSRVRAIVLPTAPRAALGPEFNEEDVPRDPPFTAYVGNLPYEVDEDDLMEFFQSRNLSPSRTRLPRDDETGRLKGFGYVDFDKREHLIEALSLNEQTIKNRKIRVSLATSIQKGRDSDRGFGRRGGSRYDDDDNDRTAGDWRSGPPPEPRSRGYEPRGYGGGGESRGYGGGESRGYGAGGGGGGGFSDSFDRSQMRSQEEANAMKRESYDRPGGGYDRRDGGYDRRDGGYDRRDGGYDRRDGGYDRREGGYDRREGSYDRREGGYDRRPGRGYSDRSPEPARERPRLQLSKRTVPVEKEDRNRSSSPSSNIFGAAKPVDTTARERQMEAKLKSVTVTDSERSEGEGQPQRESTDSSNTSVTNSSKKPSANIFGSAKPVDTAARERQIEEKLRRQEGDQGQSESGVSAAPKASNPRRVIELRQRDQRGRRRAEESEENWEEAEQEQEQRGRDEQLEESVVVKKNDEAKPANFVEANKFAFLDTGDNDEVEDDEEDKE